MGDLVSGIEDLAVDLVDAVNEEDAEEARSIIERLRGKLNDIEEELEDVIEPSDIEDAEDS